MTAKEMLNSVYGKVKWDDMYVKPNYVRYTDADIAGTKALADCWKVSDRYSSSVSSAIQDNISYEISAGARDALVNLIDARVEELKRSHPQTQKNTTNTENKKENNMNNTVKNVLFLAPGYQYAKTVVTNQSKELDRKKIPYNASTEPNNFYIHTDKVHVEIVYLDPIKWTATLFQKRDAVFGKKELIDKAHEQFFQFMIAPKKSLSKYIKDLHADPTVTEVKPRETYLPEIKNAYFNNPMTVVLWEDGTKTMVRCQEGDVYSAETGLALCIAKKAMGNMPNFNNVFRKWIPEEAKDDRVVLQVDGVDFAKAMAEGNFLDKFKNGIQRAFGYEGV